MHSSGAETVRTRSQLVSSGRSAASIDGRLRSGLLLAPYRGIYVEAGTLSLQTRWLAALSSQPKAAAAISHRSAAVGLGIPWIPQSWSDAEYVDLTVTVDCNRRERRGMRIRHLELPESHVIGLGDLTLTSPARTVIDLIRARDVNRYTGLQLLDGLLRFDLATHDDLTRVVADLRGSRGIRRAEALVELARPHVDSPQETRMRLTLVDGGIEDGDIDVNIEICDGDGRLLVRGDLGSRLHMMWWEYDGYETHSARGPFADDRKRDRWLKDRGWSVSRFSSADMDNPHQLVAQWRREVRGAIRRVAALPAALSPEVAYAKACLDQGA